MEKMKKIYDAPTVEVVEIMARNVICNASNNAPALLWLLDDTNNISTSQEWSRSDYGSVDSF